MYGLKDFAEIYFQAEDLGFNGVEFKRYTDVDHQISLVSKPHDWLAFSVDIDYSEPDKAISQVKDYLDDLENLISLANDEYGAITFVYMLIGWFYYDDSKNEWINYSDVRWKGFLAEYLSSNLDKAKERSDQFAILGEGVFFSSKELGGLIEEMKIV